MHIGRGPNHGHYVAVVKSGGRWLLFDDEIVELVSEQVCVCMCEVYPFILCVLCGSVSFVDFGLPLVQEFIGGKRGIGKACNTRDSVIT